MDHQDPQDLQGKEIISLVDGVAMITTHMDPTIPMGPATSRPTHMVEDAKWEVDARWVATVAAPMHRGVGRCLVINQDITISDTPVVGKAQS